MQKNEIAWAAGLLEGEGNFRVASSGHGLQVSCGMTDEDVIRRLQSILGGTINGPYLKENRKPVYTWSVTKRSIVVPLLENLLPYMGNRRSSKIQELLKWNKKNPIGKPRKDVAQHGSISKYMNNKCRCGPCKEAHSAYNKQYLREWRLGVRRGLGKKKKRREV